VEPLARVIAFGAGVVVVLGVLSSAVRTVVVPRGERVVLSNVVFFALRRIFTFLGDHARDEEHKETRLARFAPMALMLLPLVWVVGVVLGFIPIYWALGVDSWRECAAISGSSVTTLGFARPDPVLAMEATFVEAIIGLALVALLISFLPTIYGHFSRREEAVARLEVRAGIPPSPVELLSRMHSIDGLQTMDVMWAELERWFIDIEESHTVYPALVWFRSPVLGRSWITAAGASLDAAAVSLAALNVPGQAEARMFIRYGFLALRRVAAAFEVPFERDALPTSPITVSRDEFYEVYERLASEQLPMKPDREQAWKDFAGWRVNYDQVLIGLCGLIDPPLAAWSSDRAPRFSPPSPFHLRRFRVSDFEPTAR
jgi:hypothetical protein